MEGEDSLDAMITAGGGSKKEEEVMPVKPARGERRNYGVESKEQYGERLAVLRRGKRRPNFYTLAG